MWKLEDDVNDYIKKRLDNLGLKKLKDYNVESVMSDYMKESLQGAAKTKSKRNFGKPDFSIEKYRIPIIIESKLFSKKIVSMSKDGIKQDDKSIQQFAVNGALNYARCMIDSKKYKEVIAIGVAGNNDNEVIIKVYYVYGYSSNSYKLLENISTLDFLENNKIFEEFYKEAILSEEEKHDILTSGQALLQKHAKSLNRLMHNHNITAPQRVLYVSGMLLAMQDVIDSEGNKIQDGLVIDDLKGIQSESKRDGKLVVDQIKEFLTARGIEKKKRDLMISSFKEISKDSQRDELTSNDKEVAKFLKGESSVNKQIFAFIYENIFKKIDGLTGHIDIIGEMYSEFLKYALGDGKEIGIVLTPPYVTKMMSEILDIRKDNKVMDLATGSASFLISAMEVMIDDTKKFYGKATSNALDKIENIKRNQLLGVELNAEMYTLAATNMILRGDGSSNIQKGNTFKKPEELYTDFKADRLLLNPPFSFEENGMPFIEFGLNKMSGGLGAIIIQDSAGSGKAVHTNKKILKKHTLLASIKMPTDLFMPMAGVQTSIYIFEVGKPHDFEKIVKFIDFRNDGYKRTKRGLQEIDNPTIRYRDIIKIYKAGKNAKVDNILWNLNEIYIEDFITESGADWNFEQHKIVDTLPKLNDFKKVVSNYLEWEVSGILQGENELTKKF